MEMVTLWVNRGLVAGQLVPVEELVRAVELIISSDAVTSIPTIVLTPKPAM
jgi:hypothetical protein